MRRLIKKKTISGINDKGSTLITVIVAIAFVTILSSIILGTTVMNVRMKGIDKRTKDEFYYAEKALNDIYTGLGQDLSVIAGEAYEKAFLKIGDVDVTTDDEGEISSTTDYGMAENAEKEFRASFLEQAYDHVHVGDEAAIANFLEGYITSRSHGEKVESIEEISFQKKDGTDQRSTSDEKTYRIAIKGVEISATDSADFRAVITTDIIINIPTVDFLGTNVDVSDYGIIANKGLYIEGENTEIAPDVSTTTITGNVYAGVHDDELDVDDDYKEVTDDYSREKLFGGINIKDTTVKFDGNYIVSKGDINLAGHTPKIRVSTEAGEENPTNMWFTSLRTLSEKTFIKNEVIPPIDSDPKKKDLTIDINANVFALNDLALNADMSSARFKGSYYGYDDATLPNSVKLDVIGGVRDDSRSSAIVVNGSKVCLDMEDINNFVLMGKAYIDFTSDTDSTDSENIAAADQIVPTAEGLAIQTNQQLYLVPNDFIDGPNPAMGGDPESDEKVEFNIKDDLDKNWFGLKYLDYGDNIDTPDLTKIHKSFAVKQKDGSNWAYFDYLVFNDDIWMPKEGGGYEDEPDDSEKTLGTNGSISSKQKFFYDIMTANAASEDPAETQPSAYRLKTRIDRSIVNSAFFDLKGITVGNESDNAHYYARNAVINYKRITDEPYISSTVRENTDGMYRYADYPQNLFRRYKWLCTKLDGKENILIGDSKRASTTVPDIENASEASNEWNDSSLNAPLCHFVWLDKVDDNDSVSDMLIGEANSAGLKKEAYGVCIALKSDAPFDMDDLSDDYLVAGNFKGVLIVDGDIIVPEGMDVTGLLMATGTITLEGNNNINNDKGIIQSRIEKEINLIKNYEEDEDVEDEDEEEESEEDETESESEDVLLQQAAYKPYYLVNYLSNMDGNGWLYDVQPGKKIKRERIEADYNDFIHYENWQKGEK